MSWDMFIVHNDWKAKTEFYGRVYKLSRNLVIKIAILLCIITPFTNWMIPLIPIAIKRDIILKKTD